VSIRLPADTISYDAIGWKRLHFRGLWLLRLDSEPLAPSEARRSASLQDSLGCHFRGTRKWLLRLDSNQQPSG
jgi:hypothetical protein